jgi:hypothetical protein
MSDPKAAVRPLSAEELAAVAGGFSVKPVLIAKVAPGSRLFDDYCGTVPHRPFPWPGPGPIPVPVFKAY